LVSVRSGLSGTPCFDFSPHSLAWPAVEASLANNMLPFQGRLLSSTFFPLIALMRLLRTARTVIDVSERKVDARVSRKRLAWEDIHGEYSDTSHRYDGALTGGGGETNRERPNIRTDEIKKVPNRPSASPDANL